jgi:hypothetical protein
MKTSPVFPSLTKIIGTVGFLVTLPMALCATAFGNTRLSETLNLAPLATDAPKSHLYTNESNGFSFSYPSTWKIETLEEHKTRINDPSHISPPKIFIYFIAKDDVQQNINIQYLGDSSRIAPDRDHALAGLKAMESQLTTAFSAQMPGFKLLSSRYIDLAGGMALDVVFSSVRDQMTIQQRELILIGKSKAFIMTCSTRDTDFEKSNAECFEPAINSITIK